ncbi:hypothetical protein CSB45_04975 [candidate division KSB3 bacterium]|uniref:Uncharacterized protein n=1 Tax=candidate division KSB3 bacterium TaxID=2044937 RepID=A0A2G6E7K7_9BACT|nr:MAG: hypothetical protein CSB45_04975 [candidate division KSB3 bacterium]
MIPDHRGTLLSVTDKRICGKMEFPAEQQDCILYHTVLLKNIYTLQVTLIFIDKYTRHPSSMKGMV